MTVLLLKSHPVTQAMSARPITQAELLDAAARAYRNPGEPSPAQAEAGAYNKPRIEWRGLNIAIENPAGSVRRGRNRHGVSWEIRMRYDYGEVVGSMGVDGDPVDIYLGPNLEDAPMVYVVHQRKVGRWDEYDEDKCMAGFMTEADAVAAFLSNYNDPRFLGPVTAMSVDEFVAKVRATKDKPAMIKSHAPLVLFFKAHVGPYLRGGKLVNLRGYQGRQAQATASPGQMSLFADNTKVLGPNPYKGKDPVAHTRDMFVDADEHGEMPPGRIARREPQRTEPTRELIAEHERLVGVLESPSHADDKAEAKKQAAELAEMKQEDTQSLKEKLQTLHDFLEVNPGSSSAPAWKAKIAEIEAKIGPLKPIKSEAPKKEVDTSGWSEPHKAAYALKQEYAKLDKLDSKAVGAFKIKIRSLAKKTPEDDAGATLIIDGLVNNIWGTDYNPKVAGVEFAPSVGQRQAEPDHLLADIPGAKWRRGKGLIAGHYGVEVNGEGIGNFHAKPEDAAAQAKQWLSNRAAAKDEADKHSAAVSKLRERLLSGGEATDSDLALLGLRSGSAGLEWFIPAAAKVFGITSHAVRPHIKDLITVGRTDMGAKKEFVAPKKGLQAVAAGLAPKSPATTDDHPAPMPRSLLRGIPEDQRDEWKDLHRQQHELHHYELGQVREKLERLRGKRNKAQTALRESEAAVASLRGAPIRDPAREADAEKMVDKHRAEFDKLAREQDSLTGQHQNLYEKIAKLGRAKEKISAGSGDLDVDFASLSKRTPQEQADHEKSMLKMYRENYKAKDAERKAAQPLTKSIIFLYIP